MGCSGRIGRAYSESMLYRVLIVMAVGMLASCASAPKGKELPTGFLDRTLIVGDATYRYVVYVPREYNGDGERWPCILFLHGSGESGTDGRKQAKVGIGPAIELKPSEWPFIVVMPQKPETGKQWEDYDGPVMAMLDAAKKEFRIDQHRVYLTGLSQGGHGTWTIGANHPDQFAAMAALCGYVAKTHENQPDPSEAGAMAIKIRNIPQRAYHGLADDVVPWSHTQLMVESLKNVGADVESFLYPDTNHNCWDKAYRESGMPQWFLKHKK